jgi:hypothetical protein
MNDKVKKLYDKIINEMTVAGVGGGGPDGTSQGVFVWKKGKKKGHSIRKSSPKLEEAVHGGYGVSPAGHNTSSYGKSTNDFKKKVENKIERLKRTNESTRPGSGPRKTEEQVRKELETNAEARKIQQNQIKLARELDGQPVDKPVIGVNTAGVVSDPGILDRYD